jgi:hypothetical protein
MGQFWPERGAVDTTKAGGNIQDFPPADPGAVEDCGRELSAIAQGDQPQQKLIGAPIGADNRNRDREA